LTRIFPTQLAIKRPLNFPPHPMSVFALPGEKKTNKMLYFCSREHYYLTKIRHTNIFPHFCHLGWQFIQLSVFQLPTEKIFKVSGPQAQRWFLLLLTAVSMMFCSRPMQTSPVTFWIINIPEGHLVDTVLHDSQTL